MLTWPIYSVITLYILTSPLLNGIIISGGIYTPIYIILGGLPVLLLSMSVKQRGVNSYVGIIYCISLFVCLITASGLTVNKYLYHSNYSYTIIIILLVAAAVGLTAREESIRYSSKILSIVCGLFIIFIIGLALKSADYYDLWPVKETGIYSAIISVLRSFFALTPILLPQISGKVSMKIRYPLISCVSVVLFSALYLLVYPYYVLGEEKNLIIEISKNISIGRFFQRIEFLSSVLFLIVSILLLIYIVAVMKLLVNKKLVSRIKRRVVLISVFLFASAVSLIAVADRAVSVACAVIAGVSIVLAVIINRIKPVKKALLPIVLCLLLTANLSSCIEYSEIDTFAYPLIVGVEKLKDSYQFYFRTEDATYSIQGESMVDAKNAVNRQNAKQLDLSQLGMVLTEYDDFETLSKLASDIQSSYIHNTVQIAVTDQSLSELEKAEFSSYSSISEFLQEYKNNIEGFDIADSTAFKVFVGNEKGEAVLVPNVVFSDGEMLMEGAVAYGKGKRVALSNNELKYINEMEDYFSYKYGIIEEGGVLNVKLEPKSSLSDSEQLVKTVEELYNRTGFDALNVYSRISIKEWTEEEYKKRIELIDKVVIN